MARIPVLKELNMAFIAWRIGVVLAVVGQQDVSGATNLAVVDIPGVSAQYVRTRDLEAQFEQRRVAFNGQRQGMQERIQRTGQSLQEELKPGTSEYERRRKEVAMLEAELQWFVDAEGRKLEHDLAGSLRSIYKDIQEVIAEVALERGIDVVLAADQLPSEPPQATTQVRQQIALQKVVYWSPQVDLTDEVVTRLNARYKARQLTSPSGAAPPSPPD
jgi:Skp family chaperone for outer membrane proteins